MFLKIGVVQILLILLLLQDAVPLRLSDTLLGRIHRNHDSVHTVIKRDVSWLPPCSTCGTSTKFEIDESAKKKDKSKNKKKKSGLSAILHKLFKKKNKKKQ